MSERIKRENLTEEIIRRFYENRFGTMTNEEIRDDFYVWLASDQDEERKLNLLEKLCEEELDACKLDKQVDRKKLQQLIEELKNRGSYPEEVGGKPTVLLKRKRMTLRSTLLRVAAAVIFIIIISGGVVLLNLRQPITAEYITAYGETKTVELNEGTDLIINAGSELATTIDKKQREVKLKGEVFFEVAKDDKRPFVVKTDGLTITVTGTVFNVTAYPDSETVTVTLNRGSVMVMTYDNKLYNLKPDQQLILERGTGKTEIRSLDVGKADDLASWKDGMFFADNASFKEVINNIRRHYNVEVEIVGDRMLNHKLTFKFEENISLSEVMERINIILPELKYEIKNNKIVINN